MGRKVFISSDMGSDEKVIAVAESDPEAALMWPWMLTYMDDWGRGKVSPTEIKARIFPSIPTVTPEKIQAAIELYADHDLLLLYEVGGKRYMAIDQDTWFSWQTHIHKEKRAKDESRFPAPPRDVTQCFAAPRGGARESAPRVREIASLPPSSLTSAPIPDSASDPNGSSAGAGQQAGAAPAGPTGGPEGAKTEAGSGQDGSLGEDRLPAPLPYWEHIRETDPVESVFHRALGRSERDGAIFALCAQQRAIYGADAVSAAVSDLATKQDSQDPCRSDDHGRRFFLARCKARGARLGTGPRRGGGRAVAAGHPPPDGFQRGDQMVTDDFWREAHRRIFDAVRTLLDRQAPVDVMTVGDELKRLGQLEVSGGAAYLVDLAAAVPTTANAAAYAEMVTGKARLRRVQRACKTALALTAEPGVDADAALSRAEELLLEARLAGAWSSQARWLGDAVAAQWQRFLSREPRLDGWDTGIADLDEFVGLRPGELIVVAGATSMGKTQFAWHLAMHVGQVAPVLYVSLEMDADELATRAFCMQSGLDSRLLRQGKYPPAVLRRHEEDVEKAMRQIWIVDQPRMTADLVAAEAYRYKRHGCQMVVVDYLTLLADRRLTPHEKQWEWTGRICRKLRDTARQLQLPFVVVAQLNREVFKRADHRPTIGDLAESGDIERAANVLLLLHRPDYYSDDRKKAPRGKTEIIVAKQRAGATGTVTVRYEPTCGRFSPWESQREIGL
jgi:replicative DNA helicase